METTHPNAEEVAKAVAEFRRRYPEGLDVDAMRRATRQMLSEQRRKSPWQRVSTIARAEHWTRVHLAALDQIEKEPWDLSEEARAQIAAAGWNEKAPWKQPQN